MAGAQGPEELCGAWAEKLSHHLRVPGRGRHRQLPRIRPPSLSLPTALPLSRFPRLPSLHCEVPHHV